MDWKAYKQAAALPFEVLDCQVAVEKTVEGSRGDHRLDVWIQAELYGVKTSWFIDCRHWDTPISKADVFALKKVLKDVRADRALMLSNSGFDSGATKAARSTSITLTTLEALQDTAELELTRTTLISLENRITKLKQSLERLSESVQVAPGLWQSLPKPGVDGDWVTKTTERLEAIKFGFAKARLQQPPYFVQKDETSGQPQLVQTIEEFVSHAVVLIEAAETNLREQHKQVTQARLATPEVEPATEVPAGESAEKDEKPKRSLHAAFFRRKVSTPPVNFNKGDRSGRDGDSGSSRGNRKPGLGGRSDRSGPGRASQGRAGQSRPGQKPQGRNNAFRPGPSEPGPSRAKFRPGAAKSRFEPRPSGQPSPERQARPASGEKPKLAGGKSPARSHSPRPEGKSSSAPPRLKSGEDRGHRRESREPRFTPSQSSEPSMEGRWWDEPVSHDRPQQRAGRHGGDRGGAPRPRSGAPRLAGGKPRLGGKKFGGKQFGAKSFRGKPGGAKRFIPKPDLREGRSSYQGAGEGRDRASSPRKAGKFGDGAFKGRKFGERKFSPGTAGRSKFKGGGFKGGQFRKPSAVGSSGIKPRLRKQSDS